MTAVIGILNKSGVALAADSAVTINGGNGRKIYNNAYKIFTLSKYHPVGVMLYNSATFMSIPWEILIKEYRKSIGTKSFNTLKEYQDDFIGFLKKNIHYINKKEQDNTLYSFIDFVLKEIIKTVVSDNLEIIEKQKTLKSKKEIITNKLKEHISTILNNHENDEILIDFKNYVFDTFKTKYSKVLNNSYKKYYSELSLSPQIKNKLFEIIHKFIIYENFLGNWTGLVFAGFGEKEIYPQLLPLKVGEVFENRIRYSIDKDNIVIIGDKYNAAIRPFAQRDVIDIILSGIDSNLEKTIYSSFESFLSQFLLIIIDKIGEEEITSKLKKIDIIKIIKDFAENFQTTKLNKHIKPLMSSISTLSKEDLAELAESLIYLTYLKRRMSFSEESVGGPIDVAIITKGDGFIWIKRKHYFNKELNQDFIYKYLKEL